MRKWVKIFNLRVLLNLTSVLLFLGWNFQKPWNPFLNLLKVHLTAEKERSNPLNEGDTKGSTIHPRFSPLGIATTILNYVFRCSYGLAWWLKTESYPVGSRRYWGISENTFHPLRGRLSKILFLVRTYAVEWWCSPNFKFLGSAVWAGRWWVSQSLSHSLRTLPFIYKDTYTGWVITNGTTDCLYHNMMI